MPTKMTGSDGVTISIPDGYKGMQGSDGRIVHHTSWQKGRSKRQWQNTSKVVAVHRGRMRDS